MRAREVLVGLVFAGVGVAGWFLWSGREAQRPAEARSASVQPTTQQPARIDVPQPVSKGADAAVTQQLPPPIVVEEPAGPPPRELSPDEPRQTKWGTLLLRPAAEK